MSWLYIAQYKHVSLEIVYDKLLCLLSIIIESVFLLFLMVPQASFAK